jgi:Domain of unknown function (DUF1707)
MSAPSGIRIGNEERDAAIKALDEHMSAGRLDPDEYGQRVAEASVARTREDIKPLFADLPEPHPFAAAPPPRRKGPVAVADGALHRYAGESPAVRLAMLVLAVAAVVIILPFALAAAVLFFVVLPMLGCGGWRRAAWYRGRVGRRW